MTMPDPATPRLTADQVHPALAYWQRRLRLQDWMVEVKIVRKPDLGDGHDAEVAYNLQQKYATVSLMDPIDFHAPTMLPYHPEVALVHELLHLHFAAFDAKPNTPEQTAQEQAINCLAGALVTWAEPFTGPY